MIEAKGGEKGRKEGSPRETFRPKAASNDEFFLFLFLDPHEGQRGSNRSFLMDYRPAPVARI